MENQDKHESKTQGECATPDDIVDTFWLHTNVSYSSGFDSDGNYYFELVNYKSGKVYREYLSPVNITAVEYHNASSMLHPHLHK